MRHVFVTIKLTLQIEPEYQVSSPFHLLELFKKMVHQRGEHITSKIFASKIVHVTICDQNGLNDVPPRMGSPASDASEPSLSEFKIKENPPAPGASRQSRRC